MMQTRPGRMFPGLFRMKKGGLCRTMHEKGAHAIILPGVSVGRYAIVGAGSVVTKDIPDYGVAVGNPAHVIRMLDPEKFPAPEKEK